MTEHDENQAGDPDDGTKSPNPMYPGMVIGLGVVFGAVFDNVAAGIIIGAIIGTLAPMIVALTSVSRKSS